MDSAPTYLLTITFALGSALGGGLLGCTKPSPETKSAEDATPGEGAKSEEATKPEEAAEPESDDKGVANLCTEYTSCDACIAGQITKGKTEGEAQTQCGAAVAGCWTTWTKPIRCGEKTYDE